MSGWVYVLIGPVWIAIVFVALVLVSANGRDSEAQERLDLDEHMRKEIGDG